MRQRAGIFEDDVIEERAVVRARVALDDVELLGVRRAAAIEPELVVEADRIDDERVAFPVTDRVSEPRGNKTLRVLAAVHADDTVSAVIHQLVQDVDV